MELSVGSRDIEGLMEDLDEVYRRLDNMEDIDDVRDYAARLQNVANHAATLAGYLLHDAQQAEDVARETEEED